MTEKELMLSEHLYSSKDSVLLSEFNYAKRLIQLINSTTEKQSEYRLSLFRQLFKKMGENSWIEPPFHCDYGYNISIGQNFYANYDCIILDACNVTIGNNVFLGPRVNIYTAGHPIDSTIRNLQLEYGKKVSIGNDVWIGGTTVINPGVTIGNNVVIGSGSVVTKNIPSGVIAAGNPCKVLRSITETDKIFWTSEAEKYYKIKNSI